MASLAAWRLVPLRLLETYWEKIAKLPSGDKSVGSVADFDILGLGFTDRPSG